MRNFSGKRVKQIFGRASRSNVGLSVSKKGEKYLEPLCPMGHIYSGARTMKAISSINYPVEKDDKKAYTKL